MRSSHQKVGENVLTIGGTRKRLFLCSIHSFSYREKRRDFCEIQSSIQKIYSDLHYRNNDSWIRSQML